MPRANRYRVAPAPQEGAPAANAAREATHRGLFRSHRVAPAGQNREASEGLRAKLASWGAAISAKIVTGFQKVSAMVNSGREERAAVLAQEQAEAQRFVAFINASRIAMQQRYEIQCEMSRSVPSYEEIVVNPPSPPSYSEVVGAPPSYEDSVRSTAR